MLIIELLDQYEGVYRRAFFGCGANLDKISRFFSKFAFGLVYAIPRHIEIRKLCSSSSLRT